MDPVIIQSLSSIEKIPDDFSPEAEQLIDHAEVVLTPFLNNDSRNIHVLWRAHYLDLIRMRRIGMRRI